MNVNLLKLWGAEVAIVVAGTITVSAAVQRLPMGSAEALVEDARSRIHYIWVGIGVESANFDFIGNTYNTGFTSHTLADGREESIRELARRSLTELEAFIGAKLKKGLEATIEKNAAKLVGRRLYASYSIDTPIIDWNPWKGGYILIRGGNSSDVFQSPPKSEDIPHTFYTVKLVESVKSSADYKSYPFTVPGIARAQMKEEDEAGNIVKVTDSVEATINDLFSTVLGGTDYPLVYHEDDTLFVPNLFVLSGKGTLRIWYWDGSEQVFRRQDGAALITYLSPPATPPFRRLGVPRITDKGIELLYEATDDEQVLISRAASDFKTWEPLPYLPIHPPPVPTQARPASGSVPVRIRTATAPRDTSFGFYRAKVVSAIAPQEARQR